MSQFHTTKHTKKIKPKMTNLHDAQSNESNKNFRHFFAKN